MGESDFYVLLLENISLRPSIGDILHINLSLKNFNSISEDLEVFYESETAPLEVIFNTN